MTDHTTRPAPTGAEDAELGLEALTDDVLPAFIARLRASRLGELEVRTAGWRIRLRRDPRAVLRPAAASGTSAHQVGSAVDEAPPEVNGSVARSPAVGYFTPSADLVVGRVVEAGDTLGAVDVLGISQEVIAPEDGIITSVLAEEGQAVEYGQVLSQIEPFGLEAEAEEDLA